MTVCRGIRGATTADANTREAIFEATRELFNKLVEANHIQEDQVASVIFTVTQDLNAAFPATAVREMGWRIRRCFVPRRCRCLGPSRGASGCWSW